MALYSDWQRWWPAIMACCICRGLAGIVRRAPVGVPGFGHGGVNRILLWSMPGGTPISMLPVIWVNTCTAGYLSLQYDINSQIFKHVAISSGCEGCDVAGPELKPD